MTWNEIVSAICICVSSVIYSFSLQGKTKLRILFIQLFSSSLYLLNFLFVFSSAKSGAITATFEILRLISFYFIEKNDKFNTRKNNLIAMSIFCVILTACSVFAWSGWICILPLIGTIIVSIALGCKNLVFIKFSFIVQSVLITIYLAILSLWINAASQAFVSVLGIVGLVTLIMNLKKTKVNSSENNEESKNSTSNDNENNNSENVAV